MEQEQEARALYESLSPDERRERFRICLAYRSVRDRLLDSEDRLTVPRYALTKWLPILGAEAFALWLVMRDMARVEAARADSWCWPDQENLATKIGVSGNTLRKLIGVLEQHGFIRRQRRRDSVDGRWGQMQRNNSYAVFLDVPLVEADAVSCLVEELTDEATGAESRPGSQEEWRVGTALTSKSAVGDALPVDNPLTSRIAVRGADLKICGQGSEEFQAPSSADLKSCAPNVSNVANSSNVRESPAQGTPTSTWEQSDKPRLREHPAVRQLSGAEKRDRAKLAAEIGETLHRMSGSRDGDAHHSLGFHRRVAFLMPVHLVQEALRATRDGVDDRRAGRGGVREDPSKYFGGIVKQLALKHGIDLGLKNSPRRQAEPHRVSAQPTTARVAEPEQSPEERERMKQAMRELREDLAAKLAAPGLPSR